MKVFKVSGKVVGCDFKSVRGFCLFLEGFGDIVCRVFICFYRGGG